MGLLEYIPWKIWITFLIVVLVVMWAVWGGRRDYEIIGLRGISDPPFSEPSDPYSYGRLNPSQGLPEPHEPFSAAPGGWNGAPRYSQRRYPSYRSQDVDAVVTASARRSYTSLDEEDVIDIDLSDPSLLQPPSTGRVSPLIVGRNRAPRRSDPLLREGASEKQRTDSPPPYSTLTPEPSIDLHLPSYRPTQIVNVGVPSPRQGPSPAALEKSHAASRGQDVISQKLDIAVTPQAVVAIEQQVRLQTFVNPNIARKVSMGEELTTKALETLLGRPVQSQIRPLFLRNPETGRPLELDCYDPVSRIAVEYSGRQHYEFPSSFFTNEQDFYNQVYRDQLKRELCDKNGVYLITVPYSVDMCVDQNCVISVPREVRYERIYNYLKDQLALHSNTSLI